MIATRISDGCGTDKSACVIGREEYAGLVVYTDDLLLKKSQKVPFLNDDYGSSLNQNASAGGTPENVHDGEDNTYWTFSDIVGSSSDNNSTEQASAGAQSLKWDNMSIGDIIQVARPSGSLDMSGYVSVTMNIRVDRRWGCRS